MRLLETRFQLVRIRNFQFQVSCLGYQPFLWNAYSVVIMCFVLLNYYRYLYGNQIVFLPTFPKLGLLRAL